MTSKFALIIANTEYQDVSFAKLTAPGKDAEEFAQVLRELAAFDDVQVLLNEGDTRTRRAIAHFFANRKRDDLLLLYFSGHGIRNEQGQLFLAANDTEIGILEGSGIPSEFVTAMMNNSRSQRQLLILDCCNSGAFAHGTKSAPALGNSMGIASAFEGSGFGRVVLTATDSTQYAWEGNRIIGDTQKSLFTHFLIEGLRGTADQNGDGCIDVDELYDYAYEQVVSQTPKQTPGKWSYKQQGDIILRDNLRPREVKSSPLPSDLLELLSHQNSGVRRAAVEGLISLLDGKHMGLARAAAEKLREIAENDDSLALRKLVGGALSAHGFLLDSEDELEKLSSQAIQYESKGDISNALQIYYKIKGIDPGYPGVEMKIAALGKELRPKPADNESLHKNVKVDKQPWVWVQAIPWRLTAGIAVGLVVVSLLIWGGAKLLRNLPTSSPQQTFASQTTQTNAPSPSSSLTARNTVTADLSIGPDVGHIAPNFSLSGIDQKSYRLDELKGKSIILDFWVSKDFQSDTEVSRMDSIYKKYKNNKGLIVFAINADGANYFDVKSLVDKNAYSLPVLIDTSMAIKKTYKVDAFPTSFFIDMNGVIRYKNEGSLGTPEIEKILKTYVFSVSTP